MNNRALSLKTISQNNVSSNLNKSLTRLNKKELVSIISKLNKKDLINVINKYYLNQGNKQLGGNTISETNYAIRKNIVYNKSKEKNILPAAMSNNGIYNNVSKSSINNT